MEQLCQSLRAMLCIIELAAGVTEDGPFLSCRLTAARAFQTHSIRSKNKTYFVNEQTGTLCGN
jgi:hypothetical protein